jgi:hypothetical protein
MLSQVIGRVSPRFSILKRRIPAGGAGKKQIGIAWKGAAQSNPYRGQGRRAPGQLWVAL